MQKMYKNAKLTLLSIERVWMSFCMSQSLLEFFVSQLFRQLFSGFGFIRFLVSSVFFSFVVCLFSFLVSFFFSFALHTGNRTKLLLDLFRRLVIRVEFTFTRKFLSLYSASDDIFFIIKISYIINIQVSRTCHIFPHIPYFIFLQYHVFYNFEFFPKYYAILSYIYTKTLGIL